jgi:hypothetical protein
MTLAPDRGAGLPMVCPFVAFAHERDLRAAEPDHRHRCYAEPRPAPRALAHQTRYCLSPGFTSCPTFQDWATREAARVADEPRGVGTAGGALPGLFDDERDRSTSALPAGGVPAGTFARAADEVDQREAGAFAGPYGDDQREPGSFVGPYAEDDADRGDGEADDPDLDDAYSEPGAVAGGRVADWDRPRARRDYPRIGRSRGVPPVLVGLVVLAIAALALFFLPTIITAVFGNRPAGASPSPSSSVASSAGAPSASPAEPTAVPSPTPLTYKVVSGDTLTKIAKKFNVTVAQILAANPTIKNADTIKVGDKIVIPTAGASASSSAAP